MRCHWCSVIGSELELLEHETARWLQKDELYDVTWLLADMQLIEVTKKQLLDHEILHNS